MANPLKMIYLNDFLGMYDWSMASKFTLNKGVSEHVLLMAGFDSRGHLSSAEMTPCLF